MIIIIIIISFTFDFVLHNLREKERSRSTDLSLEFSIATSHGCVCAHVQFFRLGGPRARFFPLLNYHKNILTDCRRRQPRSGDHFRVIFKLVLFPNLPRVYVWLNFYHVGRAERAFIKYTFKRSFLSQRMNWEYKKKNFLFPCVVKRNVIITPALKYTHMI